MRNHDHDEERLSALIDGELTESEAREAVEHLLSDADAMHKWRRYHLIRDSLQGYRASSDRAYDSTGEFTDVAHAEINQEQVSENTRGGVVSINTAVKPVAVEKPAASRDRKAWGTGLAMAAALATVVIFGLRFNTTDDNNSNPVADTVVETGERPLVAIAPVDSGGWDSRLPNRGSRWTRSGTPAVATNQQRLNALLVRHGEHISLSGMNGLSGYARFVSFDERQL